LNPLDEKMKNMIDYGVRDGRSRWLEYEQASPLERRWLA
jgi:hypothetical protein